MGSAIFEAANGKESIVCTVILCSLIKLFLCVWGTCFLSSNSWEEVGVRGTCVGVFTYELQKRVCVCVCDVDGRTVCSRTQFRSVSAV